MNCSPVYGRKPRKAGLSWRRRESNPRRRSGPSESEEDADLASSGALSGAPEDGHEVGELLSFIHDGQLALFDLPED